MLTRAKDILQGKVPVSSPRRSSKWPKVRNEHLAKCPKCEVCGGTKKLNVHHIKPYNHFPELELEPTNLVTLCEAKLKGVNCHLWFGHLGNYREINPNVIQDSTAWKNKLQDCSSVEQEHLNTDQRVEGSNPSSPTI